MEYLVKFDCIAPLLKTTMLPVTPFVMFLYLIPGMLNRAGDYVDY